MLKILFNDMLFIFVHKLRAGITHLCAHSQNKNSRVIGKKNIYKRLIGNSNYLFSICTYFTHVHQHTNLLLGVTDTGIATFTVELKVFEELLIIICNLT